MKKEDRQKLSHGAYKVTWKKSCGGGSSIALIGSSHNGDRWIWCANWSSPFAAETKLLAEELWDNVKTVEKLN